MTRLRKYAKLRIVLIPTSEVARMLGVSVATVNRWAKDPDHPLKAAQQLPGETGARLFERSAVILVSRMLHKGLVA